MDDGLASGWWAQSFTVAYEQHIGRRVPGQDYKGRFQVAVTRTLPGSMDDAMAAWMALVDGVSVFDSVAVDGEPRTSATKKWRHWRVSLADGAALTANTTGKAGGKSPLTVTHDKLAGSNDVERWRAFWKAFLAGL